MISVILGYRDKELIRVKRCLDSLARQTSNAFEVLLVDYGSHEKNSSEVRKLVESYAFAHYIFTDSRGHPWSRAKALNIGIKRAQYEYVFTNDIDMLFPSNTIEEILNCIDLEHVFHVPANFLGKDFNDWDHIDSISLKRFDGTGRGIMVIPKKYLHQIHGYDEYYFFWGSEDMDISDRLSVIGVLEEQLPDHIYLHHQWHPTSYDNRPSYFNADWEGRMENYRRQMIGNVVRNDENWGEIILSEKRDCWNFIDINTYKIKETSVVRELDLYPQEYFVQTELVNSFHDLKDGESLIINNSKYPRSHSIMRRIFNHLNRFLYRSIGIECGIAFSGNMIHQFVMELIFSNQEKVKDYFLDVNRKSGADWILKR